MSDTSNATSAMPLPNSPEARTPDGTLRDQAIPPTSTPPEPTDAPSATPPAADAKPTAAPSGPPDTYSFTVPDGQSLDDTYVAEATPVFRELGLDQASAQRLVDTYLKLNTQRDAALLKGVNDMRADWRDQVMKDPQLGGKLQEVTATIGRMKDAMFVTDKGAPDRAAREAFDNAMDLTGAGDHPAIVKAWYKASQAFVEGQHVSGSAPSAHGQRAPGEAVAPTAAQAMYPNLPSAASTRH